MRGLIQSRSPKPATGRRSIDSAVTGGHRRRRPRFGGRHRCLQPAKDSDIAGQASGGHPSAFGGVSRSPRPAAAILKLHASARSDRGSPEPRAQARLRGGPDCAVRSTARDEGREDSDVDLLVHFEVGPTLRLLHRTQALPRGSPRSRLYADDIIEACGKIRRFTPG